MYHPPTPSAAVAKTVPVTIGSVTIGKVAVLLPVAVSIGTPEPVTGPTYVKRPPM